MEQRKVFRSASHRVFVAQHDERPGYYHFRWVALDPVAGRKHYEHVVDQFEAEDIVKQMESSPAFVAE